MKKCLIFGFGKQGKKYADFFSREKYIIEVVTKRNKVQESFIRESYLYDELDFKNFSFNSYEYVIICVEPNVEQTKVILKILSNKIVSKIIIEKPVTADLSLLKTLIEYNNVIFNIDEVFLNIAIKKEVKNIRISSYPANFCLEHAFGPFLKSDFFDQIVSKTVVNTSYEYDNGLNYDIYMDDSLFIKCRNGFLSYNDKVYGVSLYESLSFYTKNLFNDQRTLLLIKLNYFKLRKILLKFENGN